MKKLKIKFTKRFIKILSLALLMCVLAALGLRSYLLKRIGQIHFDNATQAKFAANANYSNGQFQNLEKNNFKVAKALKKSSYLKFLFGRSNAPDVELPTHKLTKNSFSSVPEEFAFYWLGHAMIIGEMSQVRFITDPVFDNAAPLPGLLKRYVASPISREELPELDLVLISHDHYDHLEYQTIQFLAQRQIKFITPAGVGERLRTWGVPDEQITELFWHESFQYGDLTITLKPTRHFSGRWTDDRNQTLWGSYIIADAKHKVLFGADGGYGSHFGDLSNDEGSFDLVMLEIDAWNERWPNNHLFPTEVLKITQELQAKRLLPIHWGVFDLADHKWDLSIQEVIKEAQSLNQTILLPQMGEKITLDSHYQAPYWFENLQ